MDIFERLKAATLHIHRQTERRVPVFDPAFDLVAYGHLLQRFYGFWEPLEAKLLGIQTLMHPSLDRAARMKTHLLEADLRTLGYETTTAPRCLHLPSIDTFPAGVGCLYVLEGSTLGARFIAQRLEAHLCLREHSGAAFFNAYGETTARRWAEFQSFVRAHVSPQQSEATVHAAVQTFERLFEWLGESLSSDSLG